MSFRPILLLPILAVIVAGVVVFQAGQKEKSRYQPSEVVHVERMERKAPSSEPTDSSAWVEVKKEAPHPALANLGLLPSWAGLDRFQKTISRETFLHRLTNIYTKNGGYENWITVETNHAEVNYRGGTFILQFSEADQRADGAIWNWNTRSSLTPSDGAPLTGTHIALDPGHIGGEFSMIEERHLKYGDHPPIMEGSMTLLTAQHLKPLLEELGARVTLVRDTNEPITPTRPSDYQKGRTKHLAEKLFYRTAEIRARAELVNHKIQPDIVVCLHYNATGSPIPISGQDFHILINGAYHASELNHEDERFQMLQRLLSGTAEEEIPLAQAVVESFVNSTALPAYDYDPDHPYSVKIADYIFSRNLLANRLYQCPVIFLEPYTMNSTEFIERHQAGDYEGFRDINGQACLSLYREYAQAVAEGLASYYSEKGR